MSNLKPKSKKKFKKKEAENLRPKVKLFGPKSAAKCLINVHDRVDEV